MTRQLRQPVIEQCKASVEERRFEQKARRLYKSGVKAKEVVTCNPLSKPGDESKKLPDLLAEDVEPQLRDAAVAEFGDFKCVVGKTDKSGMNALNHLFTREGGDQAMDIYWDELALATALAATAIGSDGVGLPLIRVNPISDEGIVEISGRELTPDIHYQFAKSWEIARNSIDLTKRIYPVQLPGGHGEVVLDLEAASRVLKHPGMVTAARFSLSDPFIVPRQGTFLQEALRRLANAAALVPGLKGRAEVDTPFESNLDAEGVVSMPRGSFVEIKFDISPVVEVFRSLIPDKRVNGRLVKKGTRKGWAEVNSGKGKKEQRGGMRAANILYGEAGANELMTPIPQALYELAMAGVTVSPVTGNYMTYYVDLPPEVAKKSVLAALSNNDLMFVPSIETLDAGGILIGDVRARFILKSMGMESRPAEDLKKMDFFVNFLEHVWKPIQEEIFDKMGISKDQRDRIELLRRTFAERRTIRDMEDLYWTLRNDKELPKPVLAQADDLRRFVTEFSTENYERMFIHLTNVIAQERKNRQHGLRRVRAQLGTQAPRHQALQA